jgi:hypothetical protein
MTTTITKHRIKRDGAAWRIYANRKPTPFLIEDGSPKFREGRTYYLVDESDDSILATFKSVNALMATVEALANITESGQ